jgi:ribosomal protein L1
MKFENSKKAFEICGKMENIREKVSTLKLPEVTVRLSDNYKTIMTIGTDSACEHELAEEAQIFKAGIIDHYQAEFDKLNSELEKL